MPEYYSNCPKKALQLDIMEYWNTNPSNTKINPILRLCIPKNAHTWMILHFLSVQIKKQKQKKIDLATDAS